MKVQLSIDDGDEIKWTNFYINPDYIMGWFPTVIEDGDEPSVNVYFAGYQMTLKQDENLKNYLLSRKDLME
jgi:hypothetical protein